MTPPQLKLVAASELRHRLASFESYGPLHPPVLFEPLPSTPEPVILGQRKRFREAAALRGWFRLADLDTSIGEGAGGETPEDAEVDAFLEEDCERVSTPLGGRWRLRLDVRRATLTMLAKTGRRLQSTLGDSALDHQDLAGTMAVAYVQHVAPSLGAQNADQLTGTLAMIDWLTGIVTGVPDTADVEIQLRRDAFEAPLRAVSDVPILGREHELAQIAAFVYERATGFRPLVIHGPGGIGKSAVISKFLLDRASSGEHRRLPFAYLTFDREDLMPQRPLGLFAEALRQLVLQFPELDLPSRDVLMELDNIQQEQASRAVDGPRSGSSFDIEREERDLRGTLRMLGEVLVHLTDAPIILVLDTFERAQRQGVAALARLRRMLELALDDIPRLRVIILGRGVVDGWPAEEIQLRELNRQVAMEYLRTRLGDGMMSLEFLEQVAAWSRGHPLTLRLAADLIIREGAAEGSEEAQRGILLDLQETTSQGMLYRRVLDHIDDTDVRELAVPGLVLRRITPEAIREVLAPACGLGQISVEESYRLFARLGVETSLVIDQDDTLVVRPDVRRAVLPLIQRDDPDKVASLHRRAVRFYNVRRDIDDRTEELYHRLALDQSPRTLGAHWDDIAAEPLDAALDELKPRARSYLAARLGIELDPDELANAADSDWAAQVARTARLLLDDGNPWMALLALEERTLNVLDYEVAALGAEALARTANPEKAKAWAEEARMTAAARSHADEYVRFSLLGAQLAEDWDDYDQALPLLKEARKRAHGRRDFLQELTAGVGLLRIHRRRGDDDRSSLAALRSEVLATAQELRQTQLRRAPYLTRDLAAELGNDLPHVVLAASDLRGIDVVSASARSRLNHQGKQKTVAILSEIVREHLPKERHEEGLHGAESTNEFSSHMQGTVIRKYLEDHEDVDALEAVSDYFKFDADQPKFRFNPIPEPKAPQRR